ncbi:MAG: hypothetical protein AAGH88_04030 [Planctomycetota bacterium]
MSQATIPDIPSTIQSLLKRANQRLLMVAAGWSVARTLTVLLAAALTMLLLDAAFAFAWWVRAGLDVLFVGVFVGGLVYIARAIARCRYEPRRAAVLVEQRLGVEGSELINAVDFASPGNAMHSPGLVRATIARGEQLAVDLDAGKVADTTPLRRALRNLGLVGLVIAITYFAAPGVFHAGLPRYLAPSASHPPFTLLDFEVRIEPDRVLYGKDAMVLVTIQGPNPPSQATVVFVDEDDRPAQRAPLSRASVSSATARDANAASPGQAKFRLALRQVEQSRRFYIDTPGGRSRIYDLTVYPVPQFESATVHYDYPAYTGWPSEGGALDSAGIRVLRGTRATLTFTSSVPLGGGQIVVQPDDDPTTELRYELTPESGEPKLASVTLPILSNASYQVHLRAIDGTPSNQPLTGSITAVPDARPRVSITEPPLSIVVPENHTVEVRVAARDDVGISRIELVRGVNGWGPVRIDLPVEYLSDDRSAAGATYAFDLASLGVVSGDVITYFATGWDNRGVEFGDVQSADSRVHVIQVISLEEYLEYERTKYRIDEMHEEFDGFLEQIAEMSELREQIMQEMQPLLDQLAEGNELSPEDMERLEALQDMLDEFEQQASDLREELEERAEMPELYEFEGPYNEQLRELAEMLAEQEQLAGDLREAAEQMENQPNDEQRRQAFQEQSDRFSDDGGTPFDEQAMQEMKMTAKQLEQLRLADQIRAQMDRLKYIIEAQRELEQRLSAFENTEQLDPAQQLRARELSEEQSGLRRELSDTIRGLREAADEAEALLPMMSASALEFVGKLEQLAVVRDMKDASKLAAAGDGRTAHRSADIAADKLESLLQEAPPQLTGQGPPMEMMQIDGRLMLTEAQLQNMMQQMAQARGIPGMSNMPGQIPGSGMGGQGMGQGGGSRAPMAVRGPNARPDSGREGRRNGRTEQAVGTIDLDPGSESIDTGTDGGREASGAYVTGVPQEYREEAEAYFRRLADENR